MASVRAVGKFFRTPKGLLTIVLAILAAMAAPAEGWLVARNLAVAVATGSIIDLVVLRVRKRAWEFPSGAVLTALIIVMVLRSQEPWYVVAATTAVAIVSEYLLRTRSANMFNPAALAIVAMFYVFGSGQSWWGALAELSPIALVALFAGGIFMANRVNKMPMVITFLGVYYLLFTITAFVSDPGHVAEIFRSPDLHAALYFAFFILTDPPTSPTKYRDQIICALIVAATSYAVFEWVGAAYYLLAGVLVGNVWETWRRHTKSVRARSLREARGHAGHTGPAHA